MNKRVEGRRYLSWIVLALFIAVLAWVVYAAVPTRKGRLARNGARGQKIAHATEKMREGVAR